MKKRIKWVLMCLLCLGLPLAKAATNENILSGHPRHDYLNVSEIEQLENDLRQALGAQEGYSFSRSWWKWNRLRQRYVDGGRKDNNAIRILRAGKKKVWLAVLKPFNEGVHPRTVAALIRTKLSKKGNTRAKIGGVNVSIKTDGTWVVSR